MPPLCEPEAARPQCQRRGGEARRGARGGGQRAEGQSPEPSDRAEFELFASAAQCFWKPSLDEDVQCGKPVWIPGLAEAPPGFMYVVVPAGAVAGAGAGVVAGAGAGAGGEISVEGPKCVAERGVTLAEFPTSRALLPLMPRSAFRCVGGRLLPPCPEVAPPPPPEEDATAKCVSERGVTLADFLRSCAVLPPKPRSAPFAADPAVLSFGPSARQREWDAGEAGCALDE